MKFQSTRPRGARQHDRMRHCIDVRVFQSTRPRGARPLLVFNRGGRDIVSIHAPAWGATRQCQRFSQSISLVSIHAPAWGATGLDLPLCGTLSSFNPRARVGRDLGYMRRERAIHARFNPRARVGRDSIGG